MLSSVAVHTMTSGPWDFEVQLANVSGSSNINMYSCVLLCTSRFFKRKFLTFKKNSHPLRRFTEIYRASNIWRITRSHTHTHTSCVCVRACARVCVCVRYLNAHKHKHKLPLTTFVHNSTVNGWSIKTCQYVYFPVCCATRQTLQWD